MLYRIKFTTESIMTIEADSLDEAYASMRRNADEMQSHCHHGETIFATLQVQINVGEPDNPTKVWATLS